MLYVNEEQMEKDRDVWSENSYYNMAEQFMDKQWDDLIWPIIHECNFNCVLEIAPGHGRNTRKLIEVGSRKITLVDLCQENLDFCKERFSDVTQSKIYYSLGDGKSLPFTETKKRRNPSNFTFVYCFDSMVHFEPEVIYNYLNEIYRVLEPGGRVFLHHSNYTGVCNSDWRYNPHARNFMHWELFSLWARKIGFNFVSSRIIDWVKDKNLDRLTLLEKPE